MSELRDILAPAAGESVRELQVLAWLAETGDTVRPGQAVCELETEKVTLTVHADTGGVLSIVCPEGERVAVGAVLGRIRVDPSLDAVAKKAAPRIDPVGHAGPAARKAMREHGIIPETGSGRDGRITLADVQNRRDSARPAAETAPPAAPNGVRRTKMSLLRRRTAEHLLAARQQTAMLTSFQDVDMGRILEIRKQLGEEFRRRHGVKLGLLSFFNQAIAAAMKEFPIVGGRIEGDEILLFDHVQLGVAVATPRGLVVPVIRQADTLHPAEFERELARLAAAARAGRLTLEDLEGGSFTLTNGGVFGSLLSTPLIHIPQSAILGMHAIQERPVARDGQILIRPMMYLALSYDHRLIDGRESVGWLLAVKKYLENPETPE